MIYVRSKDGKGRAEIVTVGGLTLGRDTFEPDWHCSENVKPIAVTHSCQAAHTGYVLEGRMAVKKDDGTEMEFAQAKRSTCRLGTTHGSSETSPAF